MKNKRKPERVNGTYFTWTIRIRNGIYQADGRGNKIYPGRHSLDTRDYHEALRNLNQLDQLRAVELNQADPSILKPADKTLLPLEEGKQLYLKRCRMPRAAGGVAKKSTGRYGAVLDKFLPFLKKSGIEYWNHVKRQHLESYAAWLDGESYSYSTEFLELTTIKQAINWLITAEKLPETCRISMPMTKPTGTDTHCYTLTEVTAILDFCRADTELLWLHDMCACLAFTGMRISELLSLSWSDLDPALKFITLRDQTYSRRAQGGAARTTKGKRTRSFPIHEQLRPVLQRLRQENPQVGRIVSQGDRGCHRSDFVRLALVNKVITPLSARFPSASDEIGFKDGRLHSFRHFFCWLCANSGVSETVLMRWLGHQCSAMVRHYYHLHDEESQRQMAKIKFDPWTGTT